MLENSSCCSISYDCISEVMLYILGKILEMINALTYIKEIGFIAPRYLLLSYFCDSWGEKMEYSRLFCIIFYLTKWQAQFHLFCQCGIFIETDPCSLWRLLCSFSSRECIFFQTPLVNRIKINFFYEGRIAMLYHFLVPKPYQRSFRSLSTLIILTQRASC